MAGLDTKPLHAEAGQPALRPAPGRVVAQQLGRITRKPKTQARPVVKTMKSRAPGGIAPSGGGSGITQLTGDVTAGPGSGSQAATIANDAVSNTKAANMAQSTIKGRAAGAGTGDPTDLSAAQVLTILGIDLTYLMPAGAIIMWNDPSVPTGWALCDGSSGTPDLTGSFIKAATSPGGTGGSTSYTPAGTIDGHTLALKQGNTATNVLTGPATHTFTGTPATIEPPYYELVFIMKL